MVFLRLVAATLATTVLVTAAAQERRAISRISYAAPPSTIEQMLAQSELVVRGTVAARQQNIFGTGEGAYPIVEHQFRVAEYIKGTGRLGASIRISQIGGVVISAGIERHVDDRDFPVLSNEVEYILFLGTNRVLHTYEVMWGPGGVFAIGTSGVDVPKPVAQYVTELRGKRRIPLSEFLKLLGRR